MKHGINEVMYRDLSNVIQKQATDYVHTPLYPSNMLWRVSDVCGINTTQGRLLTYYLPSHSWEETLNVA